MVWGKMQVTVPSLQEVMMNKSGAWLALVCQCNYLFCFGICFSYCNGVFLNIYLFISRSCLIWIKFCLVFDRLSRRAYEERHC